MTSTGVCVAGDAEQRGQVSGVVGGQHGRTVGGGMQREVCGDAGSDNTIVRVTVDFRRSQGTHGTVTAHSTARRVQAISPVGRRRAGRAIPVIRTGQASDRGALPVLLIRQSGSSADCPIPSDNVCGWSGRSISVCAVSVARFRRGVVLRWVPVGCLLVRGDGAAAHDELGDDGGEECRDDEARSASCFGDEHDASERDAVARAEEGGDPNDGEQGCVERVERASDHSPGERARHDERDEQSSDASPGNGG